jgi:hypothetical protein
MEQRPPWEAAVAHNSRYLPDVSLPGSQTLATGSYSETLELCKVRSVPNWTDRMAFLVEHFWAAYILNLVWSCIIVVHTTSISGPSARKTKDLLKLSRDQLRWIVGLLTGHCHLKGHLFKLGLTDDPTCERCLKEDESATCPVWLWGCSSFEISSPGTVLHGTKWLLWRPHK